MVERVGCGAVDGMGRDWGRGDGRPKSRRETRSLGKGTAVVYGGGAVGAEVQAGIIVSIIGWLNRSLEGCFGVGTVAGSTSQFGGK